MSENRIIQLINNPQKIEILDRNSIEEVLVKYPFAQSFQMLNLKWKHNFITEDLNEDIQKVSIYTTHRELINNVINESKINQKSIQVDEEQENDRVFNDKLNESKEEYKKEKLEETLNLEEMPDFKQKEIEASKYSDVIENAQQELLVMDTINKTPSQSISQCPEIKHHFQDEENKTETSYQNINKLGLSHLFLSGCKEEDEKEKIFEQEDNKNEEKEKIDYKKEANVISKQEDTIAQAEKLSFNQWISLSQPKPQSETTEVLPTQEKQNTIISNFIENNPKIIPPKKESRPSKEIGFKKEEIQDIANLMTITLAQLYVEQGKYDTAITAFKILSLKYPEKSSYFASEIRKIKKIKNSK